jgi:hypothetical protein
MTLKFTAFVWNMQRKRSFHPPSGHESPTQQEARRAVRRALKHLCQTYDVGFITEPGMDLRDIVEQGGAGLPEGTWIASSLQDNQSNSAACRPLIYVKNGEVQPYTVKFKSGQVTAERYPAGAVWSHDGHNVLLVAFHATSGGNGAGNTQGMLDWIDDHVQQVPANRRGQWTTWVIGADFNASEPKYSTAQMPNCATHQSGGTLDGFFAERDDMAMQADRIEISPVESDGDFTLVIGDSSTTPLAGCYFGTQRVSDHLPVVASFTVDSEEEDDDDSGDVEM